MSKIKVYCDKCKGSGKVSRMYGSGSGHFVHTKKCDICEGKGYIVKEVM